jgi:probable F420-dependent oxidoreductase
MKIGFNAPMAGPLSEPETLTRICVEAEAMGFDYATFSDHIVIPSTSNARYPYSETGEFPGAAWAARHEQLTEVAFIAAKTSRLRLVTSVMVVPHRPALLCAKMLSTIDVLSRGRLIVGAGAGWLKEEFEALGAPPFAARGAVTDEYLRAFQVLWTEDAPHVEGEHVKFADIVFAPKPVQKPHPPIWVGGESGPALRRAVRLGNAWYPIGTNPTHPLDSLARYRAGLARLRKVAGDAGRDPASIGLAYRVARYGEELPMKTADGERRLFSGKPTEIAGDLRDLGDLGVTHVDFSFTGATAEEMLDAMKRFRDDIVSRL